MRVIPTGLLALSPSKPVLSHVEGGLKSGMGGAPPSPPGQQLRKGISMGEGQGQARPLTLRFSKSLPLRRQGVERGKKPYSKLPCSAETPAVYSIPRCSYAPFVATLPRGVRSKNPSCSR